jgi:hypothetical protein
MVYRVRAIIEILGNPKEHIQNIMEKIIERIEKTEEGIEIIKKDILEPNQVKDNLFSMFVELELNIENNLRLNHFCFDYLPSSIEILDAETMTLETREITAGLNDLLARLHEYNVALSNLKALNKEMTQRLKK